MPPLQSAYCHSHMSHLYGTRRWQLCRTGAFRFIGGIKETVDHETLLDWLKTSFGIGGRAICWSYLVGRILFVDVGQLRSVPTTVTPGVHPAGIDIWTDSPTAVHS